MLSEAQTRQRHIDRQLAEAGWGSDERTVLEEYELGIKEDGTSEYGDRHGFADYVLLAIKRNVWGQNVRLEQERIAWAVAWKTLQQAV